MVSVHRLHLSSLIPFVGCELNPDVQLRRPDDTITSNDSPTDGYYVRYKWYRNVPICSVHPSEAATLQCLGCVKAKLPLAKSYHCSSKCFLDSWLSHHRALHARVADAVRENGAEGDELLGSSVSGVLATGGTVGPTYGTANTAERVGGETWYEVGHSKTYTPTPDDVGHVLKLECVAADGVASNLVTACVIPAPSPAPPTPRRLTSINGVDGTRTVVPGKFTVLCYNVLSPLCVLDKNYRYCPPWALSWQYRRQNLLLEIIGYDADILCLQEVQSDHFEEFFAPEFEKHGYETVYKKKTTQVRDMYLMGVQHVSAVIASR